MTSNKEHKYHDSKIYHTLIITMISCVFIFSDWMYGVFTFSEYIIFLLIPFLILTKSFFLTKKDAYIFSGSIGLLLVHNLINIFYNDLFIKRVSIYGTVKLIFYIFFILVIYRYIKHFKLEKSFLKYLNIFSVLLIIVGLYIIIAINVDFLPYEFFWTFTRSDIASYYFRETTRMRSVFSEPAHLGFFLNTILGINLFTSIKLKYNQFYNIVITLGIILTFSYSSIVILAVMMITYLMLHIKSLKKNINSNLLWFLLILLIVLFINWDFFYNTMIVRTIQIIQGNDGSAFSRIIGSWSYFSMDNLITGNGIANSPPITNIYAYMLTDFGIFGFLISFIASLLLVKLNTGLGIIFVLLNFQKGGYLSPTFSFLILLMLLYYDQNNNAIKKERN